MIRQVPAEEIKVGDFIIPEPGGMPRAVTQVRRGGGGDVYVVYAVGGLMEKMPPMHPHQPVEVEQ